MLKRFICNNKVIKFNLPRHYLYRSSFRKSFSDWMSCIVLFFALCSGTAIRDHDYHLPAIPERCVLWWREHSLPVQVRHHLTRHDGCRHHHLLHHHCESVADIFMVTLPEITSTKLNWKLQMGDKSKEAIKGLSGIVFLPPLLGPLVSFSGRLRENWKRSSEQSPLSRDERFLSWWEWPLPGWPRPHLQITGAHWMVC